MLTQINQLELGWVSDLPARQTLSATVDASLPWQLADTLHYWPMSLKLYADTPTRRTRQIAADAWFVVWGFLGSSQLPRWCYLAPLSDPLHQSRHGCSAIRQ